MERSSNETISDIVADPEGMSEEVEPGDPEELEHAQPIQHRDGNAFDVVGKDSLKYVQSMEAAKEEAQIPVHVSVKDIIDRDIVIARKWKQKAALPDTGELREGYFCDIVDVETLTAQTVWIGQVALMRDLERIPLPVATKIRKRGRTYIFS